MVTVSFDVVFQTTGTKAEKPHLLMVDEDGKPKQLDILPTSVRFVGTHFVFGQPEALKITM